MKRDDRVSIWLARQHARTTAFLCSLDFLDLRAANPNMEPSYYFARVVSARRGWTQHGPSTFRLQRLNSHVDLDIHAARHLLELLAKMEIRELAGTIAPEFADIAIPAVVREICLHCFDLRDRTDDPLIAPSRDERKQGYRPSV